MWRTSRNAATGVVAFIFSLMSPYASERHSKHAALADGLAVRHLLQSTLPNESSAPKCR